MLRELAGRLKPTVFLGYETAESPARLSALLDDSGRELEEAPAGAVVQALLERTPFFAQNGGQLGDRGRLEDFDGRTLAEVQDAQLTDGSLILHRLLLAAPLRRGDLVKAKVDPAWRRGAAAHHTAAHLLNAALRSVLRAQPRQADLHVAPDGLRLDFAFPRPLSEPEIAAVQDSVRGAIRDDLKVWPSLRPSEDAERFGALSVLGENHTDRPRFVLIGRRGWSEPMDRFSLELCNGTHCRSTVEVLGFSILRETAAAAGVRRIEAAAGPFP